MYLIIWNTFLNTFAFAVRQPRARNGVTSTFDDWIGVLNFLWCCRICARPQHYLTAAITILQGNLVAGWAYSWFWNVYLSAIQSKISGVTKIVMKLFLDIVLFYNNWLCFSFYTSTYEIVITSTWIYSCVYSRIFTKKLLADFFSSQSWAFDPLSLATCAEVIEVTYLWSWHWHIGSTTKVASVQRNRMTFRTE